MIPMTERVIVTRRDERGVALIAVLLLLMMMSALAAALGVSGQTETFIARNSKAATQAQVAAEAGLNHAVEVATNYIFEWKTNGCTGATVDEGVAEAVHTLLAGPGATTCNTPVGAVDASLAAFLDVLGIPADNLASGCDDGCLTITAGIDATYEVLITDDDDGDMDLTIDANERVLIRSTGYAQDGTKVVLEVLISPIDLPAVVTNGDLVISGNVAITGPAGETSVHTNSSLTFDGGSSSITGNVSSTGELSCADPCDNIEPPGIATEGAAEVPIPSVNAANYEVWADFILGYDGTLTDVMTGGTCAATDKVSCNDWTFVAATGTWLLNSSTVTAGTYYVQANPADGSGGHATISGSPGSKAAPAMLSLVAEGSIDISGSPKLVPDTPELLFVTNQDLKIAGTFDLIGESIDVQGQMLVKGQIDIGGNATLDGQLIVEDEPVGSLVASNHIHGNASITSSGGLGTGTYSVSSWRDVRDAD